MRLFYHDSALNDIERIIDYLEPLNPTAAVRLGEGILDACVLLETHPKLGASCDDLKPGLRVLPHRGYGIDYAIDDSKKSINVIRVLSPGLNVVSRLLG